MFRMKQSRKSLMRFKEAIPPPVFYAVRCAAANAIQLADIAVAAAPLTCAYIGRA